MKPFSLKWDPLSFIRKSIKNRLMTYFICLSILPILLVGFIPYQKSAEIVKGQVLEFAQSTINQLNENINYQLKEMELMSRIIYYQFFSIDEKVLVNGSNQDEFNKFLTALKSNRTFIDEIHVIIGEQKYTTAIELKRTTLESKEWYKSALNNLNEKTWVGPHISDYSMSETKEVISLVYSFMIPKLLSPAIIIIEMKFEKLVELFKSPNLRTLGTLLLIDKFGQIIYSTTPLPANEPEQQANQYMTGANLIKKLGKENSFIYDINFLTGWKIAAFIPNSKIEQSFASVKKTVFVLLGVFLMISIFLGWTMSKRFIGPLIKLQIGMRQVRKGNFQIRSSIRSDDEIGDLSDSFNQMVMEIKTLMERIAENERKKKRIEMQSLQYQINPHFLYNTLNSVQWLAKLYKAPDISEMLTSLIKLLRASLNSTSYLHMLEEELEILFYYTNIQRYRFIDKFKISYHIEPEVMVSLVPRFILQPLVENSFFHGFTDGEGEIEISARRVDQMVEIKIADNGKGVPPEKLHNILQQNEAIKNSSGIGIRNVDEKIKLYFGKQCGLSIHSEVGQGTSIYILLPYAPKSEGGGFQ